MDSSPAVSSTPTLSALPESFERRLVPGADAAPLDISRSVLPPQLRPGATLAVLDISEYFAETSGGVRTYLLQKARYVEERAALRQILVVPGARDAIGATEGVRCYRLHGPLIPMQHTYRFMLATRSIGRIVAHERPDVVEVGSNYFAPWLVRRATARYDVPAVWFYHSHIPRFLSPRGAADHWARRQAAALVWTYVRRIAAVVDTTIVASEFVQRDLERAGITRTVHVPLGVDMQLFHPWRRGSSEETRRRLGLPEGPFALFVGRLSVEKDLHTVIRAWDLVFRRTGRPLVLVGAGPLQRQLLAHTPAGALRLLPFEHDRARLADLYAAAHFLVSPCPTETFGLAALEALASGTPVLSCDSGGVAETVRRSCAGVLYPAGDAGALAEAAVTLLGSDLEALGHRGREHAERHHTWDRVFDRIVDVYRGVLRG